MRISVIVPVLNETEDLCSALELLAARVDLFEVILVDASRSGKVSRYYGRHQHRLNRLLSQGVRFIGSTRAGRGVQMNLGAENASGQMLVFLHLDTRLPLTSLVSLLKPADTQRCWGRFDVQFDSDKLWAKVIAAMMNFRSRLGGIATGDQAIFVDCVLWRKVGGYSDIPLMEDIDLSWKLKRHVKPLCLRERVVTSARRWQTHGVVRTVLLMWILRLKYWLGASPEGLSTVYREVR